MLLLAVVLVPGIHGQEIDPDDVIRVKTTLVNSPVLVLGRDGKFVPNLRQEDFQIFENGVKQEISYFAAVDEPFTVALLIDTSRSTVFDLEDIQSAALAFVEKMRPRDRASVISFSDEIKVIAEPASDRETLRRAIKSIRAGGGSRVYDAIDFVLARHLNQVKGRTALVLFSDGVDNDSRRASLESTLRQVERTETLIYPVQFSTYDRLKTRTPATTLPTEGTGFSEQDYRRAAAYLSRLAEISNTGVYPASEISHLDRAIASIVDELHNEYSVGYYPRTAGQPGEQRSVEVRINRPQLTVRALTRYVVDRSGTVMRTANAQRPPLSSVNVESSESLPVSRNDPVESISEGRWICETPDVPSNMAIVKEGFVAHCPKSTRPNDETNAWLIRKPARSEKICKAFLWWQGREVAAAPVPEGYVVIGEIKSAACANSSNPQITANAWEIRVPGPSETVCKGFPLPHGYVMVGERFVPACPPRATDLNAWLIRAK